MSGEQSKSGSDRWEEYEKEKQTLDGKRYEDEIRRICERLGV